MAFLLIAIMGVELVSRQVATPAVHYLAWSIMGVVALMAARQYGAREVYLLVVCAALTGYGLWSGRATTAGILGGLEQGAFLMAFILLLGLLHEAAATSPSVREVGAYLTRQPQGRRYYALNAGTSILTVLFNIGVVSFLVPLIQKGIERATPNDPLNPIRERRQVSALLRGFAWAVIWSPTAVAPLALMEMLPNVDRSLWIAYGGVLFVMIMVVGALEDKLRFRKVRAARKIVPPPLPVGALLRFLAACGWLMAMITVGVLLTGDTVVSGLIMACPAMLVGWIVVQNGVSPEGRATTRKRFGEILLDDLPSSAPLGVTLAASGFVGRVGAEILPSAELAAMLGMNNVPDFIILSALPIVLTLLSLLAFSPIMLAIFFGSFFSGLPELPTDPTLLALAISCGWSLSMTASPFATVVLLTQQVGDIPARRLTWGWNLGFSALTVATMVPFFWVLTQL
ncbi:hypothetical protein PRI8871_01850 [Pseudoprimorskyibacter insulae]|uniref:Uncharacterized protein n=2 Tax=Pseudoprimorskyibacter insulae TaxID=1695997 RepID=A0A2R8AVJ5_9RHOB|nr:hypothetical protein PRI8871_01850 [Pseudoprimorskyibacter insulae]